MNDRSCLAGIVTLLVACISMQRADAADPALIAAAKKEGSVTWYTTLIVNQMARPAVDAFERKYGVKVNYIRNDSADIMQRVLTEARAGQVQADIYDGVSGLGVFKRANLLQSWLPDMASIMPKDYYDPAGYWIGVSLYIHSYAYNTDIVQAADAPASLDDLLNPKWRGQLALGASPSTTGVVGFVGHVLTKLGEQKGIEYLRKLALQRPAILSVSARQVMDMVIAGEYKVGVQMLTHHAAFSSMRGAPVEWVPTDDAMGALLILGLFKGPHSSAGKLLIDFLMSDEGQAIFRDADYIPASPNVAARQARLKPDGVTFKARFFTPDELDAKQPEWMKVYQDTLK